jgi:hypothetical protein
MLHGADDGLLEVRMLKKVAAFSTSSSPPRFLGLIPRPPINWGIPAAVDNPIATARDWNGLALYPRLEPAIASPVDLDALTTETCLATSSSAKRMDGTGTAAGHREGRAVEHVSCRENLASFSSWGRLTA